MTSAVRSMAGELPTNKSRQSFRSAIQSSDRERTGATGVRILPGYVKPGLFEVPGGQRRIRRNRLQVTQ